MTGSRVGVLCRHNHRPDHDDPQQRGQDVPAQSVLHHRHGPLRHRLLPVRLRGSDGVRRVELLLKRRPRTQMQGAQATRELAFYRLFNMSACVSGRVRRRSSDVDPEIVFLF